MISRHSVFLATKPLQLIISEIIAAQLDVNRKDIIIVDSFHDAHRVANIVAEYGFWTEVRCVRTRQEGIREALKLRADDLFIDSDVGFRSFLYLFEYRTLVRKPIWVYEEGVGSYRTDLYAGGLKKWLFERIGVGVRFGGCRFTNGLYVFSPDKIQAQSLNVRTDFIVHKIDVSFQDYCVNHLKRYCHYFNISEKTFSEHEIGGVWHLYLSNWSLDMAVDFAKRPLEGLKILKPHPHIKYIDDLVVKGFDVVLDGGIPVELLLIKMAATSNKIIVWRHHGSSASEYIKLPNVDFRMLY
jgi:hypothetical protein